MLSSGGSWNPVFGVEVEVEVSVVVSMATVPLASCVV